jgi:acyl dehydratase
MGDPTDRDWYFEDFSVGQSMVTMGRTITETDLVNFVTLGGIFEEVFINAEYAKKSSLFSGRVVPGLLILVVAEGLYVQTGRTHKGRAFLGLDAVRISTPVICGDTIRVRLVVDSVRSSESRPDTGVLTLSHEVINQSDVRIMTYVTSRLMQRRAPESA